MNKITKAFAGTVAASALAASTTSPAIAGDRYDDRGINAGEVIAGALIIGGIAAVLSNRNNRDDRYYDRRDGRYGYDDRYNRRGNYRRTSSRQAVNRCIKRAERRANRMFGNARVTEVRDIDRTRYGYKVRGRIEVSDGYRGRGYNRGYRRGYGGYDRGKFTCYFERGRVADIRYKGLGRR